GRDERAGARTMRSRLVVLKRDAGRTLLYMEVRESRNRDVRRMLATLGHPVRKLRRVKMGPLQLKGLQAGEWRELTSRELAVLREQAFATPQERAARKDDFRPSPAARESKRPRARGGYDSPKEPRGAAGRPPKRAPRPGARTARKR
ncbi:MAG: hypothetical protein EBU70_12900, partial [Actinobacteria bacterium]|nr:hypothetical protein [Actinomycetota bacterium]